MSLEFVDKWEVVAAKREVIPYRNFWTRTATAEYLGVTRETLNSYIFKIAVVVKDFRDGIPRNSKGNWKKGFSLTHYQFWVVYKIAQLMRLLKADVNGTSYVESVRQLVARKNEYLSYSVFLSDLMFNEVA